MLLRMASTPLVGEIIPFGARPFDPAKKLLEKGITGPARGPKDATVTIVEFGDLAVSRLQSGAAHH